jgi:hypothetical protein
MPKVKSNVAPDRPGPDIFGGYKTVEEAAKFLHLSERRVYDFLRPRADGKGPRLLGLRMGRQWLIPIDALMTFRKKPRRVGRPRKEDLLRPS